MEEATATASLCADARSEVASLPGYNPQGYTNTPLGVLAYEKEAASRREGVEASGRRDAGAGVVGGYFLSALRLWGVFYVFCWDEERGHRGDALWEATIAVVPVVVVGSDDYLRVQTGWHYYYCWPYWMCWVGRITF